MLSLTGSSAFAQKDLYREIPGVLEFTGQMVLRPLQVRHWMERGFTEDQARERYREVAEYIQKTLGNYIYDHREVMDEYWFDLPKGRTENDLGRELVQTEYFRYVCPNWRSAPPSTPCPDDKLLDDQWHLKRIEACSGWQIHSAGHDSVVLALIDTGMLVAHEDLSDLDGNRRLGYDGYNRLWENEKGADISDADGHGTKALGAAAATGDNYEGVSGIGWSLRHRMIKVMDYGLDYENVFHGMWVAAGVGDRVILPNVNIADDAESEALWNDNAYELKQSYDLLIVIPGGNWTHWEFDDFPDMIAVGGTDMDDEVWYVGGPLNIGSTVGPHIDVMALAVQVFSTCDGDVDCYSSGFGAGTSWAGPQGAGLCALLWSYKPNLTADEVQDYLFQGCDAFNGYDPDDHGYGRINVFNSLALESGFLWTRSPVPGIAGQPNDFKAAGATPSATVKFYYGTQAGSTAVSGCTNLYLGIASPTYFGSATSGANGAAIISVYIPSGFSGNTYLLQCVEESTCRVSNVVTYQFP